MGRINSWKWVPESCDLKRVDPDEFLDLIRNKNIGLVGDSLNENFLASFLCILRAADAAAKKWKRKGAWRGAYFPKFNVIVAYHLAVLLEKCGARINFQKRLLLYSSRVGDQNTLLWSCWMGSKLFLRIRWLALRKYFPRRYLSSGGYSLLGSFMVASGIRTEVACLTSLMKYISFLWFDPSKNGVNKEVRKLNRFIAQSTRGTSIRTLDLTHLSEFRADAHPAIWLGKKDAVAVWGQDCMHWCLPGIPDTWVDILTQLISYNLKMGG